METSVNKFKVLIIGDSCVGKTSLLQRHIDGKFTEETVGTIGIDYRANTYVKDHKRYDLQIWDTAGQERFRAVTSAYYRDAHAALLVFDLTSHVSFSNVPTWHKQLIEQTGRTSSELVTILVGNKCDCDDSAKTVTLNEIQNTVSMLGISSYIQTSAKNGSKVDEMFEQLLEKLLTHQYGSNRGKSIKIATSSNKPALNCCTII